MVCIKQVFCSVFILTRLCTLLLCCKDLEYSIHMTLAGQLRAGGTVVEGTAGNTGIGLAHICKALGYHCVIFMPDTQSQVSTQLAGQTHNPMPRTIPFFIGVHRKTTTYSRVKRMFRVRGRGGR